MWNHLVRPLYPLAPQKSIGFYLCLYHMYKPWPDCPQCEPTVLDIFIQKLLKVSGAGVWAKQILLWIRCTNYLRSSHSLCLRGQNGLSIILVLSGEGGSKNFLVIWESWFCLVINTLWSQRLVSIYYHCCHSWACVADQKADAVFKGPWSFYVSLLTPSNTHTHTRVEGQEGHIFSGANPVGVGVTLYCLHNILWTSGWILTKFYGYIIGT